MVSKRIDVRVPVADYEKYQKLAMKFGATLSDLVRNAMAYTYLGRTK